MKIELLAPAKNADIGITAINHGADAVYIGAPLFSARKAAGSSVEEIGRLSTYAHQYGAKVLVALNTILTDSELLEAEKMIKQLYEVGVDALIIQDMGILELNLPPIALHASTQCDNRTPEKVQMLEAVGFDRVVLARELSLEQIATIRAATTVELEAFVHGALCVSYSGACYASQAVYGRSANKGACAQLCRLPYNLLDANNQVLQQQKHLLSLKDLDRSLNLRQMIEAGVSSLKIEGRLKEESYVKNIVSYYRQKIDELLLGMPQHQQASWGKTTFFFTPQPDKTFHRSQTDYFIEQRTLPMVQLHTPKSTGEYIGEVRKVEHNAIVVETQKSMANGDGFTFGAAGFLANRVEGQRIFPSKMPLIKVGEKLYRNVDHTFEKQLQQKTAERKLPLQIVLSETEIGFELTLHQPNSGCSSKVLFEAKKELANREAAVVFDQIKSQLSKLGNTVFYAEEVVLHLSEPWFIPASLLNLWRREAIEQGDWNAKRIPYKPKLRQPYHLLNGEHVSYQYNVYNRKAEAFYKKLGATYVEPAFEGKPVATADVMTCKYCIKFEMGWCIKQHPTYTPQEPLYLQTEKTVFQLHFDCKKCEMKIRVKADQIST